MIKTIILILIFYSSLFAGENITNAELLETLRLKYYSAVENEDSVSIFEEHLNTLSKEYGESNIITAYEGALFAVKSKHAFWPFSKLTYLKDSMRLLDKAVTNSPENLEIRFIRFSILHYVPDFLGWNEEKNADKDMIVSLLLDGSYDNIPSELVLGITNFLIESERLSHEKINLLNTNILLTLEK
ncbi:MAG: hypothetical protein SCALA702_09380 [Melioribacteraceae bacterium]|nr:MAG: hypothetical protein SCALA702_09380 [Melioribacteraceae bacterium]